MGWDDYIAMLKNESKGVITEGAVCGVDGTIYAASNGLQCLTADQIKNLAGSSTCMNECGPTVGTIKCMLLKDDRESDKSFCMHLKGNKSSGLQTICVGRTKSALVIAVAPPACCIADAVFRTTKYLRDNNV